MFSYFRYAILHVGNTPIGIFDCWYLDYIQITKYGETAIKFPMHQWITESGQVVLMTNKTCIPQKDSAVRSAARVPAMKNIEWTHPGLPGLKGNHFIIGTLW